MVDLVCISPMVGWKNHWPQVHYQDPEDESRSLCGRECRYWSEVRSPATCKICLKVAEVVTMKCLVYDRRRDGEKESS